MRGAEGAIPSNCNLMLTAAAAASSLGPPPPLPTFLPSFLPSTCTNHRTNEVDGRTDGRRTESAPAPVVFFNCVRQDFYVVLCAECTTRSVAARSCAIRMTYSAGGGRVVTGDGGRPRCLGATPEDRRAGRGGWTGSKGRRPPGRLASRQADTLLAFRETTARCRPSPPPPRACLSASLSACRVPLSCAFFLHRYQITHSPGADDADNDLLGNGT